MNKRILGAGAASAVLAAMPLLGVFAEDQSITDTVVITVASSCTMERTAVSGGSGTYNASISNGVKNESIDGSQFTIKCNDNKGWKLSAVGASDGSTKTDLVASEGLDGHNIATGTTFSGTTSAWAFKFESTGGTVQGSCGEFSAIPGTATVVAQANDATADDTVNVTYGAYISADQPAGTYTGKVTYTLSHPAGE